MLINNQQLIASIEQVREIIGDESFSGLHFVKADLTNFLGYIVRTQDTLRSTSYILNESQFIDNSLLKEFSLSFLRAYQLRNMFELLRDTFKLPDNVSPSKLKGSFDLQVPMFLISAVREFTRGMYCQDQVIIPDVVTVEEDDLSKIEIGNGGFAGPCNPVLARLGIYIRPAVATKLQATFRSFTFATLPKSELLEFCPLTFRTLEDKVDYKSDHFVETTFYAYGTIPEHRYEAVQIIDHIHVTCDADVDNVYQDWFVEHIPGVRQHGLTSWAAFQFVYLSRCDTYTGSEFTQQTAEMLWFSSLTHLFDKWHFPEFGKYSEKPTLSLPGANRRSSRRDRKRKGKGKLKGRTLNPPEKVYNTETKEDPHGGKLQTDSDIKKKG